MVVKYLELSTIVNSWMWHASHRFPTAVLRHGHPRDDLKWLLHQGFTFIFFLPFPHLSPPDEPFSQPPNFASTAPTLVEYVPHAKTAFDSGNTMMNKTILGPCWAYMERKAGYKHIKFGNCWILIHTVKKITQGSRSGKENRPPLLVGRLSIQLSHFMTVTKWEKTTL